MASPSLARSLPIAAAGAEVAVADDVLESELAFDEL